MPTNFGYVRVSLDKQSISPIAQKQQIEEYARMRGWNVGEIQWFQDAPVAKKNGGYNDAVSGRVPLRNRMAGGEMVRRCKKGDRVICTKLDRLFRNFLDFTQQLQDWADHGVIFSCQQVGRDIDPNIPIDLVMIRMMAIFAEYERSLISQRTREAHAVRRARGQATNRFPGYGYEFRKIYDKDSRRYIKTKFPHAEERAHMKQLVIWHNEGWSWYQCADMFAERGIMNRYGNPWNFKRCQRAYAAELIIQMKENLIDGEQRPNSN